jgi:hypothetical protein
VLTFYGALVVLAVLAGAALIPPGELEQTLRHPVDAGDYVQLAGLVATLATVGGALGSLAETDLAVWDAAYRQREDERTEGGG